MMLSNLSPAVMRVMLLVWICTLIVTIVEIIRIYRKNRLLESRRLRRIEEPNIRRDIFERAAGPVHEPEETFEEWNYFADHDTTDSVTVMYEPSEEELSQFIRLEFQEIDGEPSERWEVIRQRVNYLGRDRERCNICVNDPHISAVHAVLTCDHDKITIKNYGIPTNATFVNGRPLMDDEEVELQDGSQVRIADTTLIIRTSENEENDRKVEL